MAKKTTKSYKQLSAELAAITEWFEGDQVDLDQAIINYEKAMAIIAELEDYLKTAKNEVRKVTAKFK